jgi:hypothetical protein
MCGDLGLPMTRNEVEERAARIARGRSNAMSEKPKYRVGETVYIRASVESVGDCGQIYVSIAMPGHNPYARHGANYAKLTPEMGSVYREKQQEPVKQTVVLEK